MVGAHTYNTKVLSLASVYRIYVNECICCRDRLGFYGEIQIIFGTVKMLHF